MYLRFKIKFLRVLLSFAVAFDDAEKWLSAYLRKKIETEESSNDYEDEAAGDRKRKRCHNPRYAADHAKDKDYEQSSSGSDEEEIADVPHTSGVTKGMQIYALAVGCNCRLKFFGKSNVILLFNCISHFHYLLSFASNTQHISS